MIERLHRWIKERLTLISVETMSDFVGGDDWSKYIPLIQWAYNTTPSHMTNHAPQKIIFGRNYNEDFQMTDPKEFNAERPADYIEYLNARYNIIHNKTQEYQQYYDNARVKHKTVLNSDNPSTKFNVGDLVMYYCGDQMVGNIKKLTTNWQGPFEITKLNNTKNVATIVNLHNSENVFTTNIEHLKLWRPANEMLWIDTPLDYAMSVTNHKIERIRMAQLITLERKMNEFKWTQARKTQFYRKTGRNKTNNKQIQSQLHIIESLTSVRRFT